MCADGELSSENRQYCAPCGPGQHTKDNLECKDCGPGRYAPTAQTDECLRCSPGRFADNNASSSCLDCETELGLGSGSVGGSTKCRECRAKYFHAGDQTTPGHYECEPCPAGADCSVKGSTLATLKLKPNFFRFSNDSDRVYECEAKNRANKNCKGGSDVSTQCADNSNGPLCAQCEPGFTMVYTGRCEACDDAQASKFFTAGGWLITTFFGLMAVLLYIRAKCARDESRRYLGTRGWSYIKVLREQDRAQIVARLEIVWTSYQIIAQTRWTLPNVKFHPTVDSTIKLISALTVFSFDINLPMSCISPDYNYYYNVVATNLGGPAFICVLTVLALLVRRIKRFCGAEKGQTLKLFGVSITYISLLLSYMVLPSVSTATLKLINCKDFRSGGGPVVLFDDMSVECWNLEHKTFVLFGFIMMLSPIGGTQISTYTRGRWAYMVSLTQARSTRATQ